MWLGKAKHDNIEHKSSRLYAQARKRTVDSVLNILMNVKISQSSAGRKAKALGNALSVAKWRLRMVGAKQELFSNKSVISSLISRLEKGQIAQDHMASSPP